MYTGEHMEKHQITPENVAKFIDWIENRGGIAIWDSDYISEAGTTYSAPVNDESGDPITSIGWKAGKIIRVINDPAEIEVVEWKEIKRFHISLRMSGNGLSIKLTDGSSGRVRKAVEKAAKEYGDATYVFDEQDAVILVPGNKTPLTEWAVAETMLVN